MAQKKKKSKNIKRRQQLTKKAPRKRISFLQIMIILFSAIIIFSMVFSTIALSF